MDDDWTSPGPTSATAEEQFSSTEARVVISHAVRRLAVADQRLLMMRFVDERTQSDIASEIGTSQMQVSRTLVRVLAELRVIIGSLDSTIEAVA